MALTAEQREIRGTGIGGSDAHHVFSELPYGCARRLWFDKRGVEPDYPLATSEVMERGSELEALVADLYARRTGRQLERTEAIVSPTHLWARVNLDRRILPVPEHDGPGALEVKTHNFWAFRQVKRDGLQPGHILQVQHALFVTGYTWGAYAVLHPDSWQLLTFDVARDDKLIGVMAEAGARFWKQVEHGPMPEPLPEIDRRCQSCPWRRTCRGDELLKAAKLTKDDRDVKVEQDEGLSEVVADYREARKLFDDAEATLDAVKNALKDRLGDREAVESNGARIYYRSQVSQRVDTAALKGTFPDVYLKVIKPSTSRPLRIYEI